MSRGHGDSFPEDARVGRLPQGHLGLGSGTPDYAELLEPSPA